MNASLFSLPTAAQIPLSAPVASKDPTAPAVNGAEVSFGCVLDGTTAAPKPQTLVASSLGTVSLVGMPVVSGCTGTAIDSVSPEESPSVGSDTGQLVDHSEVENAGKPVTRPCRSSQRNAPTDAISAVAARIKSSAKCASLTQGAQEQEEQCSLPGGTIPTPVGKDTGSLGKRGPSPARQEHPEQSMSLAAPGMAVAADQASLCVPGHSMPGLSRINSSTTDGELGGTEGSEIASQDVASVVSDEQPWNPSPGARVQPAVPSLGHEKAVGQRPDFSIPRSHATLPEGERSSVDRDGEVITLTEHSTTGAGDQTGGILQESQAQQKGYPKTSTRSFVAGPAISGSSVAKSTPPNGGGLERVAPTRTEGDHVPDVEKYSQVPAPLGGPNSICGKVDDQGRDVTVPAAPGSQPRNVNVRTGMTGEPTDAAGALPAVSSEVIRSSGQLAVAQRAEALFSAADSSPVEAASVFNGLAVSAGYSPSVGQNSQASTSGEQDSSAVAENHRSQPQSSSQPFSGLGQHRTGTASDKGLGQTTLDDVSLPGVRAESHTMPENSQAFVHASNRSMVMRRYGMISPIAGVEPPTAAVTTLAGTAPMSTVGEIDTAAGALAPATSSGVVPVSPANTALTPAGAQGVAIASHGRAANEPSTSKGKASTGTSLNVDFSASPSKQLSGRGPSVDQKNRQHSAEDMETVARGFTGIGNAKSHANMSTASQFATSAEPSQAQPTLANWLSDGLARLGSASSQGSAHDDVAPASQAGQLVDRVEKAVETLQSHAGKVVRFEVGGPNDERLAVSMQLRDGVLQTVFQTSSQELRDVLARDWTSSVSGSLQGDTSLKVAEPVFNGGGRNDFSDTGADSRQRQQQEAARAQQVPAEASLFGLSRRSSAASAAPVQAQSQATERHVLSSRGLNAIA